MVGTGKLQSWGELEELVACQAPEDLRRLEELQQLEGLVPLADLKLLVARQLQEVPQLLVAVLGLEELQQLEELQLRVVL